MNEKLTKVWLGRDEDESLWWFLDNPIMHHNLYCGFEWLARNLVTVADNGRFDRFEEETYDCNFKLPAPGEKVQIWIEL